MVPAPLRLNAWRVGKPPISEMHQCLGVLGKGLSGLAQDYIDWFRANKLCACSDSTWVYNAADAVGTLTSCAVRLLWLTIVCRYSCALGLFAVPCVARPTRIHRFRVANFQYVHARVWFPRMV